MECAAAGSLTTLHDGPRPSKSYTPMKKQGAIILGIGGDNSPWAGGIFVRFSAAKQASQPAPNPPEF